MKAIEKLLILTTVVLLMVFSGLAGILIVYGKQFKVEVLEIELKPKASASETQVSLANKPITPIPKKYEEEEHIETFSKMYKRKCQKLHRTIQKQAKLREWVYKYDPKQCDISSKIVSIPILLYDQDSYGLSLAHHHNKQYNIRRAQYHNKPHKSNYLTELSKRYHAELSRCLNRRAKTRNKLRIKGLLYVPETSCHDRQSEEYKTLKRYNMLIEGVTL